MIDFISSIFSNLSSFINNVKNVFEQFFDLFSTIINFLPSPFSQILQTFLGILVVVLVIKAIGAIL